MEEFTKDNNWQRFLDGKVALHVEKEDWPRMSRMLKSADIVCCCKRDLTNWPEYGDDADGNFRLIGKMLVGSFTENYQTLNFRDVNVACTFKDFLSGDIAVRVTEEEWPTMAKLCENEGKHFFFSNVTEYIPRGIEFDGIALVFCNPKYGMNLDATANMPGRLYRDMFIVDFSQLRKPNTIAEFAAGKFAVRCNTKWAADTLMNALEKEGYLWMQGQKPTQYNNYEFPVHFEFHWDRIICKDNDLFDDANPNRISFVELDLPMKKALTFDDFKRGKVWLKVTKDEWWNFTVACVAEKIKWQAGDDVFDYTPPFNGERCVYIRSSERGEISFGSRAYPDKDTPFECAFSDLSMPEYKVNIKTDGRTTSAALIKDGAVINVATWAIGEYNPIHDRVMRKLLGKDSAA